MINFSTTSALPPYIHVSPNQSTNNISCKSNFESLEDIKKFIDDNKEELKIKMNGDNIELYLKTKSDIVERSTIIDTNGDIKLNYESDPSEMKRAWVQDKDCHTNISTWSTYSEFFSKKIQIYKEILNTLCSDGFNYYKVNVNVNDIATMNSCYVAVKKMTVISKIDIVPSISYEIHDIENNGALKIIIKNNLTHSESPYFIIKVESEADIPMAISKRLTEMADSVELSKTKGKIEISDLSKSVQDFIKMEEKDNG